MDWYTISNTLRVLYNVFNWSFYPGFAAYAIWRHSAHGTWQRMICRRIVRWMFPPLVVSYFLGMIYYLVIDQLVNAGIDAFCFAIYAYYYSWFSKQDDDDDENWRKLKKRVRSRLRRRVRALRPAWNPS